MRGEGAGCFLRTLEVHVLRVSGILGQGSVGSVVKVLLKCPLHYNEN